MKRRILSMAVVFAMVLSLVQTTAYSAFADISTTKEETFDVNKGSIDISKNSSNEIVVKQNTTSTTVSAVDIIKITGNSTQSGITIDENVDVVNITLDNADINLSKKTDVTTSSGALEIFPGAKVNLTLVGNNNLVSGEGYSGIGVYSDKTTTSGGAVSIIEINGPGSLTASGGKYGAGIGGKYGANGVGAYSFGDITVKSGTINTLGGEGASGIGNAYVDMETEKHMSGNINIAGGNLTSNGGRGFTNNNNKKISTAAIGGITTATSISIGNGAVVKAYSADEKSAIYGTAITGTQSILNLSLSNDAVSKLTTSSSIILSATGHASIELKEVPSGYRGFAVTVEKDVPYYIKAVVGTPTAITYDLINANDRGWTFKSSDDGNYFKSSPMSIYEKGTSSGGGSSSNKPSLNTKTHVKYMDEYTSSKFKPDQAITRGEVAGAFARLMDKPINTNKTYKNSFSDVSDKHMYAKHIGFLEEYGILKGYPDGTFRPNEPISRAEFAVVASRFDKLEDVKTNVFKDIDEDNMWAVKAINSAHKKGWIDGYPNGKFKPNNDITRAEVTKIVSVMLDRVINADSIKGVKILKFDDLDADHWAYYYIIESMEDHDYTITNKQETWKK